MTMKYLFMNFMSFLMLILMVLVGVAYLTLLERKLLGMIQFRVGPNKVGFMGLLQPFSDALKLFLKEVIFLYKANNIFYYMGPVFMLVSMLILWLLFPNFFGNCNFDYDILFMLCIMSMGSYSILISGWSSHSNYAFLGAIRSISQVISYEVSFFLLLYSLVLITQSFNFFDFISFQSNGFMFIMSHFFLFLMFYISVLAELNRIPFDLIEGESELVSGFNVEYFGMNFALIFLAEYGSIMFISMLLVILFMGFVTMSFMFFVMFIFFNYSFIWIRGVLPRMRFDMLMFLCWKIFLPVSLIYVLLNYSLMILYMIII